MGKRDFRKRKFMRTAFALAMALIMALSAVSFGYASISDDPNIEIVSVNDIPGVLVGNYTDVKNATGTTAIICTDPNGATGGVSVLGGSPATRETDLLDPTKTVQILNAVCLSGGSAFGLDAAGGVMKYLEKKGIGVPVGVTVVPIVPTACIFDLQRGDDAGLGADMVRPGVPEGYAAAEAAFNKVEWKDGNVGGGTGAGAGGMKGGLGSFCYKFGDLYVGVVVVVNAAGQVIDPETGEIIAGRIDAATNTFIDNEEYIVGNNVPPAADRTNTTISCVITNAKLTQSEAKKLAEMAHDGYSRAIEPTHSPSDGDTVFVMATGMASTAATTWGQDSSNMSLLGVLAVNAMERAIVSAVYNAESAYGLLGAATLRAEGKTPAQPNGKSTPAIADIINSPSLRFAETAGSGNTGNAGAAKNVSVDIDKSAVNYTAESGRPFIDANNRVQVPFRQTLEAIGAEVSWDSGSKTAKAVYEGVTVEAPVGQKYILKDGEKVENDTVAVNMDGRIYLPIRIVLEAFGFSVDWDAESGTVVAASE